MWDREAKGARTGHAVCGPPVEGRDSTGHASESPQLQGEDTAPCASAAVRMSPVGASLRSTCSWRSSLPPDSAKERAAPSGSRAMVHCQRGHGGAGF